MARVVAWAKVLAVLVGVVGSVWTGSQILWASVGNVTTDDELVRHDTSDQAHQALQTKMRGTTAADLVDLRARLEVEHHVAVELGAFFVSSKIAENEPRRDRRSAIAARAVQRYRALVQRGFPVDEAIRDVLAPPLPGSEP